GSTSSRPGTNSPFRNRRRERIVAGGGPRARPPSPGPAPSATKTSAQTDRVVRSGTDLPAPFEVRTPVRRVVVEATTEAPPALPRVVPSTGAANRPPGRPAPRKGAAATAIAAAPTLDYSGDMLCGRRTPIAAAFAVVALAIVGAGCGGGTSSAVQL